jgi:hypothetical protein
MDNTCTYLALRLFNPTRSTLIIRRFKRTGVWSVPVIEIDPIDDDPMNHIDKCMEQISQCAGFELIAALPIITIDEEDLIWNEGTRDYLPKVFRSVIYEIQYEGFISTHTPDKYEGRFDMFRWVNPTDLKSMTKLNRPTAALSKMMEKESCLS